MIRIALSSFVYVTLLYLSVAANPQGIPLDQILKDGVKSKGGGDSQPGDSQTLPPAGSPRKSTPSQQAKPDTGVKPSGSAAPFQVRMPEGWRASLTNGSGMLAQNADGSAVVAVLPVLDLGKQSSADWLRHNAAAALAPYLPKVATAAVYPSRMGAAAALASLEFERAGQPGKSSVLLATNSGVGTLYVIASPARSFAADRPALLSILRSFSFAGVRDQSTGTSDPGVSAPPLSYRKFQDPAEQAFILDVPANWKVEGGLIRRSTVDVSTFLQAISPEGITVILGDRNLPKFIMPTSMMNQLGFGEGREYSPFPGNVMVVRRYMPGPIYAQYHATQLARAFGLANVKMEQARERRDMNQQIPSIGSSTIGGEVKFSAAMGNRQYEGYVLAATSAMTMQGVEGGVWNITMLVSYLAPRGMTSIAHAAIAHMVSSIQMNPRWVSQQRQMTAETYRAVKETNDYIAGVFRETNEYRQRVQDRQHREFGDVIRGVVRLRDNESGEELEGKAGNNYYWRVRNIGTIVGSDVPSPPPNIDVMELEQVR